MSELELWNELGNIYAKTGALDEAIRTYLKVIELNPGCSLPYSNLASFYVGQGRYAEAIPMFQKGIELLDDTINQAILWNQLGDAYRKLEDYANACASYRRAVELDPQTVNFQKNLAEVELASQISASEAMVDTDLKNLPVVMPDIPGMLPPETESSEGSKPGNACWVFEGNQPALQVEGNSSDAETSEPVILGSRSLDLADGISPIDPPGPVESIEASTQGLLRLGILHWRKAEYERAIQFMKIAIETAGRSQNQFDEALSYFALAQVETDLGKIEDAIQAYQSAANLAPERIFPWNNLGDLNCMLGRFEDARAAFQEAIEHNSKDPVSWNGLGDVYYKLGRHEDAIAAYQLGNVFEKQSNEENPLKEFENTIDSDQENPQIWNEAGNIYYKLGAYDDAIASYRKAIELDPANATFKISLAKAEQALEETSVGGKPPTLETLMETNPEPILHCEPFIAENPSLEAEETNRIQPDPAMTGQAKKDEAVSERVFGPETGATDPEPAASYWMFKPVPQHENVQQPKRHYLLALPETGLDTINPLPDFTLQTRHEQTFSCDQVLTDTFHDNASILVQLTPRPLKPAGTEELVNIPVAVQDQASAPVKVDSELQNSSSVPAETKARDSASQVTATENLPADQSALDLQILENDISAYRRVTEINPKNDRAWDTLGNMYEKIGLHNQAVPAFEQAIALAPHKEVYHYHLGIALGYQMQYNKAIQALQKVIELNPSYMLAHCALAGYYRRLGRDAEAQEHMQIARPSMEDENEYNQACFESIGGNADRAIALLEIALKQLQVQPSLVQSDPDLDFIRKDPRFKALLVKNSLIREKIT